jgi:hypothetical protein
MVEHRFCVVYEDLSKGIVGIDLHKLIEDTISGRCLDPLWFASLS